MIVRRPVAFSVAAGADLEAIHDYVEQVSSNTAAKRFIGRLEGFCLGFDIASERGTSRPDLMPGLRTVGFEARWTIVFVVEDDAVRILRVFGAGRDWEAEFQ